MKLPGHVTPTLGFHSQIYKLNVSPPPYLFYRAHTKWFQSFSRAQFLALRLFSKPAYFFPGVQLDEFTTKVKHGKKINTGTPYPTRSSQAGWLKVLTLREACKEMTTTKGPSQQSLFSCHLLFTWPLHWGYSRNNLKPGYLGRHFKI